MAYSGLTGEQLLEYKEDDFSDEQIDKLNKRAIRKLDEKLQKFTTRRYRDGSSWNDMELRLVLLGKTGEGKSSTGNLILGRNEFRDSPNTRSETQHIHEARCYFDGTLVRVIDTPGFHDTERGANSIATEIAKVMDTFSDGIHGFLFVFSLANPRFTDDQVEAFKTLSSERGIFGPDFMKHCFVILSHGNDMVAHQGLEDFIAAQRATPFGNLIRGVEGRVAAVDNGDKQVYSREGQRKQILELIMSGALGAYDHEVIRKFKENQEQTKRRADARMRQMVPFIEEQLSEILEQMPHEEIKGIDDRTKTEILQQVLEKVNERYGCDKDQEALIRETIGQILAEKQERLTSETFLDKVKMFAEPILKVAGQLLIPFLVGLVAKKLRF